MQKAESGCETGLAQSFWGMDAVAFQQVAVIFCQNDRAPRLLLDRILQMCHLMAARDDLASRRSPGKLYYALLSVEITTKTFASGDYY